MRDGHRLLSAAASIWHINGTVRRNLHVAVQSAAIQQRIDWHARSERDATVVAARAKGGSYCLGTIVDRVRVDGSTSRQRSCDGTRSDRLVVSARGWQA